MRLSRRHFLMASAALPLLGCTPVPTPNGTKPDEGVDEEGTFFGGYVGIRHAVFSPDNKLLLVAYSGSGERGGIDGEPGGGIAFFKVFDVATGERLRTFRCYRSEVLAV